MTRLLRYCFFALVVRPILLLLLGVNVRGRMRLPADGPAIVVANHNSHLDTMTLLSLFPLRDLPKLRPVAAMDYFMARWGLRWFALNIVGILPIPRGARNAGATLTKCADALDRGEILILFPEGSRGEPERLSGFKRGIAHLARLRPEVPVVPVFLHGLGKALPRGTTILVPFNCDVFVGESVAYGDSVDDFMATLEGRMGGLAEQGQFPPWE
ncbi:MAG: lysophospholipid acyltransferase family protein [Alphaproteobacteria bacterium]|jgi:1-acyl-sn-glycerol-3-phosphate acyltransferase